MGRIQVVATIYYYNITLRILNFFPWDNGKITDGFDIMNSFLGKEIFGKINEIAIGRERLEASR